MNKVEAFKNEMANYTYYVNMLTKLEEKLDVLYYDLEGVKAVRYDKAPSKANAKMINEKKHFLSKEIEKTENEISRLTIEIMYVEDILAEMDDLEIRKAIIDVYIKGKTILEICDDYSLSNAGLHYQMNKCIEKALNRIYKEV